MRLILLPPNISKRCLSQIFNHSRAKSMSDFIHQPGWEFSLWIALCHVVEYTTIFRCSRAKNEASNITDCSESLIISLKLCPHKTAVSMFTLRSLFWEESPCAVWSDSTAFVLHLDPNPANFSAAQNPWV